MATDAELIKQIRCGKREVYSELFRKYYKQVYNLCLSILRNDQRAEEITQTTFIEAYLKLDQLRKPDSFLPWLKKIAKTRARNRFQKFQWNTATHTTLDEARSVKDSDTPDEQLLRQELVNAIMEAIEALPVRDRDVVHAHIDGLNHR